jgi:hypothetical protein
MSIPLSAATCSALLMSHNKKESRAVLSDTEFTTLRESVKITESTEETDKMYIKASFKATHSAVKIDASVGF